MFMFYSGAATGLALAGMVTSDLTTVVASLVVALIAVGVAINKTREV